MGPIAPAESSPVIAVEIFFLRDCTVLDLPISRPANIGMTVWFCGIVMSALPCIVRRRITSRRLRKSTIAPAFSIPNGNF
jgi:hypothetical protein